MKLKKRSGMGRANVDLIPMIDVVFQLILFFLVSTTFALLPAITLDLPESETSDAAETSPIILTVQKDGSMWLNQDSVTLETLESALRSYPVEAEKRETHPVNLEADEDVTNGTIVRILDALRRTGFAAVNLRTSAVQY